ncbi:MAG: hypothetical protein A2666_04025 [Parcubacteria group bacterium RIFCSPHIGHO2_01_FULL_47_10b]|nr:MAG: hypothetical protein A2666_04025 [Parcubacteria group bacterium RIFCSPHIGHO2_01_FULL_47_10b]
MENATFSHNKHYNTKAIGIGVAVIIVIAAGGFWWMNRTGDSSGEAPQKGGSVMVSPEQHIRIVEPVDLELDQVPIPARVRGEARPQSASLEVYIQDANGKLLGSKRFHPSEQASSDPLAYGAFDARVPFELSSTKDGFIEYALIAATSTESATDSAETVIERLRYPIRFTADPVWLNLYYARNGVTGSSAVNDYDCSGLEPVKRLIVQLQFTPFKALTMLLEGPTTEEYAQGFRTEIPKGTKVQSANIDEKGELRLDFNDAFKMGGGSCHVQALRAQLEKTLNEQFEAVDSLRITVNESAEGVLEP